MNAPNVKQINWLDFCIPCGSWCCYNESPFASKQELVQLKVEKITTKEDGSCIFLDKSGRCEAYENRPLECRIYPFDIQEIEGSLFWVIWNTCPSNLRMDLEKSVGSFEREFSKRWSSDYITRYVEYHKSNQPEKYSRNEFRVIRQVKWPNYS